MAKKLVNMARGGSESESKRSGVGVRPKSQLCKPVVTRQRKINVDYSTNLPSGRVLVMSDGKCKSSFISSSVVLNATMEQVYWSGEGNFNNGHEQFFDRNKF